MMIMTVVLKNSFHAFERNEENSECARALHILNISLLHFVTACYISVTEAITTTLHPLRVSRRWSP